MLRMISARGATQEPGASGYGVIGVQVGGTKSVGELELRTMKVTDCGSAVFASLSLPPRKPIRVRSIP